MVISPVVRDACHVFLNAHVGEYVRRANRYTPDPKDTTLFQCAVLGAGERALAVLQEAHVPRSEGETVDLQGLRLDWETYVKVGLHPVRARELGMPISVRLSSTNSGDPNELLGHPLNIATMFAKFLNDQYSARLCVRAFRQIAKVIHDGVPHHDVHNNKENPWEQARFYRYDDRYRYFGFWTDSWVCPDPRKYGLEDSLVEAEGADLFMAYPLLSWYSKSAAEAQARSKHWGSSTALPNMARAMQIAELPHAPSVLAVAATACIKERWEDVRPDYAVLTALLRTTPGSVAATYLSRATGTKAVLKICLNRATRDQMTEGLSALAQRGEWIRHLSGFYGRAPTVSELCGLRAKRLIDVLYFMPSAILQEVLEEDDAAERLRARLLREVQSADPTMLRAALTQHDKRAALVPYPFLSAPTPISVGNTKDNEWDLVYGELAARYSMAIALRSKLTEIIPDEMVRVAAILATAEATPAQPILRVLQTAPNWEEAQALIKAFSALFKPLLVEGRQA